MSLKRGLAFLLVALAPSRADAAEAELLAGWGQELNAIVDGGHSAYGAGWGCRAGTTIGSGVYLGGIFVQHAGLFEWAEDAAQTSTYRAAYHETYVEAEIGYDLQRGRPVLVRPYLAAGAMFALGRTAIGREERRDDRVLPVVSPGLLVGPRVGPWLFGLDLRMTVAVPSSVGLWAPAVFLVAGTSP